MDWLDGRESEKSPGQRRIYALTLAGSLVAGVLYGQATPTDHDAPEAATTPSLRVPLPPRQVEFHRDEVLPIAQPAKNSPLAPVQNSTPPRQTMQVKQASPAPAVTRPLGAHVVPISFDAVLCLARDQNGQVRIAREKLQEAYVEQQLTRKRWLPEIGVGVGYWRHEGGIQDFYGNMIKSTYNGALPGVEVRGKIDVRDIVIQRLDAERRVWQQQGELSRFTSEQLLDVAVTYIDFLSARSAEAIGLEAEQKLLQLLEQARNLEKVDPGVRVEAARVEAELGAQKILTRRLREGASAAVAKLIYLLGLDPTSELLPQETQIFSFNLVNHGQATQTLVETALRQGPGVQELQMILALMEEMRAKGQGFLHLMPSVEVSMGEGASGALPGGGTDWTNRWDLGVQARWNVTELFTGRERKRLSDLKIRQAYLNYEEMRGKLTLGVQEACEAARSSKEQTNLAAAQITHAEESYNLSDMRLRQNIKGRSPSEVLLAIRTLVGARLGYLHAVRDFDKAQVRLFILTGAGCEAQSSGAVGSAR